jgi:hypothetical protein
MFKNKKFLIMFVVIMFSLGFIGCGYKQQNIQQRDIAYLKFKKSMFKKYTVLVNKKYAFQLGACENSEEELNKCEDPTRDKLYEVTSGRILIEVTDISTDELILRKEMYLGSSNTTEIILP